MPAFGFGLGFEPIASTRSGHEGGGRIEGEGGKGGRAEGGGGRAERI